MDTQHGPSHQAATSLKGQTEPHSSSMGHVLFTALHPAGEDKLSAKGWQGANTGKIHSSHELFFIFFPPPFKPVRKDAFLWVVCDELWLYWLWGYYPRKFVLRTWSLLLGSHHCWHGVAPSYFTASYCKPYYRHPLPKECQWTAKVQRTPGLCGLFKALS